MLSVLTTLAILGQAPTAAAPPTVTFNAAIDVVTIRLGLTDGKTKQPIASLTLKDFAVKVDKKPREIASVEYVTDQQPHPYYLIAFKPLESERGTGTHSAVLSFAIKGKFYSTKVERRFTVPKR